MNSPSLDSANNSRPIGGLTRISSVALFEEGDDVDNMLPFPRNISSCTTVQLSYWAHKTGTPNHVIRMQADSALRIISEFSREPCPSEEQFVNIAPLATFPDKKIVNELFNSVLQKMQADVISDMDKIKHVASMIKYALYPYKNTPPSSPKATGPQSSVISSKSIAASAQSGSSRDSSFLSSETVLTIIVRVAAGINERMSDSTNTLCELLKIFLSLMFAAISLKIQGVSTTKMTELQTLWEQASNHDSPIVVFYGRAIQQAFLRITDVATDYELAAEAAFTFSNGTVQLALGILSKDPMAIMSSIATMASAAQQAHSAMIGTRDTWFDEIYVMYTLAEYDKQKFYDFFVELGSRSSWKLGRRVGLVAPEVSIAALLIMDDIIRDRFCEAVYIDKSKPGSIQTLARNAAFDFLEAMYIRTDIYKRDDKVRTIIVENLQQYCTMPDNLQACAKEAATKLYSHKEKRAWRLSMKNNKHYLRPNQYWSSISFINGQMPNADFVYLPAPRNLLTASYVAEAFNATNPIPYKLEMMRMAAFRMAESDLKEDLITYIPACGSQSGYSTSNANNNNFLFDSVRQFMYDERQRLMLVHGNAGSGKSLFSRYVELELWKAFTHNDSFIPVFISLPAFRDPSRAAIRSVFAENGFSDPQISQLRQSEQKILFLLDGFDEIQTRENLYITNKFNEWKNAKVIITARTEYLLGIGNYSRYFLTSEHSELLEYYIVPFGQLQQKSFFDRMIQQKLSEWPTANQYFDAIASIPGLASLANNPFMLRILTNVLPTLRVRDASDKDILRADVYEAFLKREFVAKKEALLSPHSGITIPKDFDPLRSFDKFSMHLAGSMFVQRVSTVLTIGGDYRLEHERADYWDQFFEDHNPVATASRFGAPLVRVGQQRAFRHKSLLEYFTAKMLFTEIQHVAKKKDSQFVLNAYLNRRSIHEEPSVLAFLLDFLRRTYLNETLLLILQFARTSADIAIAAGNALTLLIGLGHSFEGDRTLSGLHCHGAKLAKGNLINADLSRSHWANTMWDGATLRNASFKEATFEGSVFACRASLRPSIEAASITRVAVAQRFAAVLSPSAAGVVWRYERQIARYPQMLHTQFVCQSPSERFVLCRCSDATSLFVLDMTDGRLLYDGVECDKATAAIITDEYFLYVKNKTLKFASFADPNWRITKEIECQNGNVDKYYEFVPISSNTLVCYHKDVVGWHKFRQAQLVNNNKALKFLRGGVTIKCSSLQIWKPFSSSETNSTSNSNSNSNRNASAKANSQSQSFIVVNTPSRILRCYDTFFKEYTLGGALASYPCDSYCFSRSGRYLLIKNQQTVSVLRVLFDEENGNCNQPVQLQQLYAQEHVCSELHMRQISDDERYVAWGQRGRVLLTKMREPTAVQVVRLRDSNLLPTQVLIFSPSFASNASLPMPVTPSLSHSASLAPLSPLEQPQQSSEQPSESELLIVESETATAVTRVRLQVDEQYEEKYGSPTRSDAEAHAADNDNSELAVDELDVFGANFVDTQFVASDSTIAAQDILLLQERGGIFLTEEEIVDRCLKADFVQDDEAKDRHFRDYLKYRYRSAFLNGTLTYYRRPRKLDAAAKNSWIHILVHEQLQDGDYLDYLAFLRSLSLPSSSSNSGKSTNRSNSSDGSNVKQVQMDEVNAMNMTPLCIAARKGHVRTCQFLLENGAQSNGQVRNDRTPLFCASQSGHTRVVHLLLQWRAFVDLPDQKQQTPLFKAIEFGHVDVCALLLANGANVNASNDEGWTPLMIAAREGVPAICQLLLSQGADQNKLNAKGHTALMIAALHNHQAVCQQLVTNNSAFSRDLKGYGCAVLAIAAAAGHVAVCELLLKTGAAIDFPQEIGGASPLLLAAQNGHQEVCNLLLRHNPFVDARSDDGFTPLMVGAQNGLKEFCSLLISRGANVNASNKQRCTALMLAAEYGHHSACLLLVGVQADVTACNADGWTALMLASQNGHKQVCELLLDRGANVNTVNNAGDSALFLSIERGHQVVAELLVAKGADPHITNKQGWTALMRAAQRGHLEICQWLHSQGININTAGNNRWTALMLACHDGHTQVVNWLLEQQAEMNLTNSEGLSPIMIAAMQGFLEPCQILVARNAALGPNREGWTALLVAAQKGRIAVVDWLVSIGMPIDSADMVGWTSLLLAVREANLDMCELLLKRGANVNVANRANETPLLVAIKGGNKTLCELLVRYGASLGPAPNGYSPALLALCYGHMELLEWFVMIGVDVNSSAPDGLTALMLATQRGYYDACKLLLDRGAYVHAQTSSTRCTALTYAAHDGKAALCDLLLSYGAAVDHRDAEGKTPLMHAREGQHISTADVLRRRGASEYTIYRS